MPHPSDGYYASLGIPQKKSLVAIERLRARVRYRRQERFKYRIPKMQRRPNRLELIEETSVKSNLARLRGRSLSDKLLGNDFALRRVGHTNVHRGSDP